MSRITYRIVKDEALTEAQERGLQTLFDAEYKKDFGKWTRYEPYGYSSFEVRILAYHKGQIIGHIGAQRRVILIGEKIRTVVAGIGGVLVDPKFRGHGVARKMLVRMQTIIRTELFADFGYLGCREEVVPFYLSCGFKRIHVVETHVNRLTRKEMQSTSPTMICAGLQGTAAFPPGDVNLLGPAW